MKLSFFHFKKKKLHEKIINTLLLIYFITAAFIVAFILIKKVELPGIFSFMSAFIFPLSAADYIFKDREVPKKVIVTVLCLFIFVLFIYSGIKDIEIYENLLYMQ